MYEQIKDEYFQYYHSGRAMYEGIDSFMWVVEERRGRPVESPTLMPWEFRVIHNLNNPI